MGSEEDDNRNKRQRRVEGATRKHRSGKKDKSRDKESCISTPNAIPLKAWCELLDAKILIILACCFVSEKKSKDKQKDKHDKVALLSRGHRSPSWDFVEEFFLSLRVLWGVVTEEQVPLTGMLRHFGAIYRFHLHIKGFQFANAFDFCL
ncbi:hypothetical protein FEM48_Zijuj05G0035800 [Ziziphus jujuba var. spinosa]|uniref:Uncharacterized protein n=1 Tax=Ziziphus jujuba var. spinosa TaxID=714518 RepID=A0A978VCK9_ZIZJJ|nr:hypothetical protein FEM48_Zijuj05G0035800 [Ziziphus jujuba var. spinosa]